jgi:hypothetical protein
MVPTQHDYHSFASDLSGLDPLYHANDDLALLTAVYQWLTKVASGTANIVPSIDVKNKYVEFNQRLVQVEGSGPDGLASHDEYQELIYSMCSQINWWDWRDYKRGKREFPELPLSWKV